MAKRYLHAVLEWLVRVATSPRSELTRWQRAARYLYDLFRYGARRLAQDRATQMAGALAYRTLFGLLPVLAVGTVLVRAFRGFDQLNTWLEGFFARLGLDTMVVQIPGGGEEASVTLSDWLLDLVGEVHNINFAAIGWIGLAVLIYASVSLMVTIENSFNTIYRAPAGRSWARRLPMYWTVLTLAPLAIGTMVYVNGVFESWIQDVDAWQWVLSTARGTWAFLVTWLVVLLVYRLVPNTSISLRAVMLGAFVTAVCIEVGRRSLGAYMQNMLSLRQLYGSLGLVPLFMFWIYLMWLVILFGLEVAATLQSLGGRRPEEIDKGHQPSGLVEPAAVVLVMKAIADRFTDASPSTTRAIAEATDLEESTVSVIVRRLEEEGFLHRVDREGGGVTLARPPERIAADRLIEIGFDLVDTGDGGRSGGEFLTQLRAAQKAMASEKTLAGLS